MITAFPLIITMEPSRALRPVDLSSKNYWVSLKTMQKSTTLVLRWEINSTKCWFPITSILLKGSTSVAANLANSAGKWMWLTQSHVWQTKFFAKWCEYRGRYCAAITTVCNGRLLSFEPLFDLVLIQPSPLRSMVRKRVKSLMLIIQVMTKSATWLKPSTKRPFTSKAEKSKLKHQPMLKPLFSRPRHMKSARQWQWVKLGTASRSCQRRQILTKRSI